MKKRILCLISILISLGINQKLLSQNRNIEVTSKRNPDKSVDILYTKKLPGSYYVKIEFKTLENSYQTDFEGVIKNSSGRLIQLKPVNSYKPIGFAYVIHSIRGNPDPKIEKEFNYVLPFKSGSTIKIKESTSIREKYFNAKKDSNWKSYVVDRTYADTVYSMRKGQVIEIKAEYETPIADDIQFTTNLNYIIVEHKDGTISSYFGLAKNSILVKLGQIVYPQTRLGKLDAFNNSIYRLYFDVSYLKGVNFMSNKKRTLSSESLMAHITPYFFTANKAIQLEANSEYSVEIDETVLLKEFTKREKKKFKKTPMLFK